MALQRPHCKTPCYVKSCSACAEEYPVAQWRFLGYCVTVSSEYRCSEGFLVAEFTRCTVLRLFYSLCYDANGILGWWGHQCFLGFAAYTFQSKYVKRGPGWAIKKMTGKKMNSVSIECFLAGIKQQLSFQPFSFTGLR